VGSDITRDTKTLTYSFLPGEKFDCAAVGMTQDFQDSRKAQIVNALRDAGAKQFPPVEPKTEAEVENARSAAATVLSAAFLRERELRFGKATRPATPIDQFTDALSSAMERARATRDEA
jgi:hypothetical protein